MFQFIGGGAGGPKGWDNEKQIFISTPQCNKPTKPIGDWRFCLLESDAMRFCRSLPTLRNFLLPSPVQKSCFHPEDEVGSLKTPGN
jgi:hypothetical protein